MKNFDIIVLNSHGVGQYADTEKMPEWGESLRVTNWRVVEDGGKGSNVSVALGRLGLKTAYIGKVGNDPWGDLGEKWMQDAGVDTTYMYRSDKVSTGTGLILIGPDGRNAIIDGDGSGAALTKEEIRTAIDAMKGSKLFITGFEVPEELSLFGAKYAKGLGMQTFLNPSPLPERSMGKLDYIDYLFVNEIEGRLILHLPKDTSISSKEIMEKIQEKYSCTNVIMTLGGDGSAVLSGNEFWEVKPLKVKNVVNTAGAGDGFLAATAAQLILGSSLKEATEWASKYAALSVTIEGTIPAYRYMDEVNEFIALHS